jgi:hypothetical protein
VEQGKNSKPLDGQKKVCYTVINAKTESSSESSLKREQAVGVSLCAEPVKSFPSIGGEDK